MAIYLNGKLYTESSDIVVGPEGANIVLTSFQGANIKGDINKDTTFISLSDNADFRYDGSILRAGGWIWYYDKSENTTYVVFYYNTLLQKIENTTTGADAVVTIEGNPYGAPEQADVVETGDVKTEGELYTVICFLENTEINTPNGNIKIKNLNLLDEVYTYKNGKKIKKTIKWIGKSHTFVDYNLPDDMAGYPVRILKDAIADGVPFKDMLITAEHCLFFDGKFVPARMLVNGRSIFFDKSITSYDYYHIETEEHSVIMADGMFTESYLDTGNRCNFSQKGKVISICGSRNLSWDNAAAPLTVSRETVEPIFRQIEARADKVDCTIHTKGRSLTNDSNLHLMTNTGAIIHPVRQNNGRVVFTIPSDVQFVQIVSNASRPCDVIGPFIDDRRKLGVLVGEITLFESNRIRTLTDHLHDVSLSGWNNVEDGTMRWTNGNAQLILSCCGLSSFVLMEIEIKAAGPYLIDGTISEQQALKA